MTDRPDYLGESRLDDLARMIAELTSELWVLKDRTLVLEHLLAQHGVVPAGAVDSLVPGPELAERLRAERTALTRRVLSAVLGNEKRAEAALRG